MEEKVVKCPICGLSRNFADMGPHGMWGIGDTHNVKFYCAHCDSVILEKTFLLDVDDNGDLVFTQQVIQIEDP